ncbi:MAG TPA: hypothetical protein VH025_11440 [Solirubrobacteraceae bacterium]|jgi:hypothetical protein|nr:hypothetical protein [Solirubrobacteraceae bacterium]
MTADLEKSLTAAWKRCADARVELGNARRERERLIREASRAGMRPSILAAAAGLPLTQIEQIVNGPTEFEVDRFVDAVRGHVEEPSAAADRGA